MNIDVTFNMDSPLNQNDPLDDPLAFQSNGNVTSSNSDVAFKNELSKTIIDDNDELDIPISIIPKHNIDRFNNNNDAIVFVDIDDIRKPNEETNKSNESNLSNNSVKRINTKLIRGKTITKVVQPTPVIELIDFEQDLEDMIQVNRILIKPRDNRIDQDCETSESLESEIEYKSFFKSSDNEELINHKPPIITDENSQEYKKDEQPYEILDSSIELEKDNNGLSSKVISSIDLQLDVAKPSMDISTNNLLENQVEVLDSSAPRNANVLVENISEIEIMHEIKSQEILENISESENLNIGASEDASNISEETEHLHEVHEQEISLENISTVDLQDLDQIIPKIDLLTKSLVTTPINSLEEQDLESNIPKTALRTELTTISLNLLEEQDIENIIPKTELATELGTVSIEERLTLPTIIETVNENVPVIEEEVDTFRSDGSDSGIGLETSCNTTNIESIKPLPCSERQPGKSNLKRRSSEIISSSLEKVQKRSKKGIQFEGVTVYFFPRQQGFGCVPSQGGCTLGMAPQHNQVRYYSLIEHAAEQRKNHRTQLAEVNQKSSSSEESDSEYEPTDSSSEADSEVYGFLQPVTTRQRRAILKNAGIRDIDSTEKDECKMIRKSREVCGCTCRVYCDPDTCACSQGGIKCQVDRPNFPCGCTRDGCANIAGRVEFNPMRVRTHYIHTVMRLQMENKQERFRSSTLASSSVSATNYNVANTNSNSQSTSSKAWMQSTVTTHPMQNVNHCDFELVYNNNTNSMHQNLTETSNPMVQDQHSLPTTTIAHDSLDLHYAYRDDYDSSTVHQLPLLDYNTTPVQVVATAPTVTLGHKPSPSYPYANNMSYSTDTYVGYHNYLEPDHSSYALPVSEDPRNGYGVHAYDSVQAYQQIPTCDPYNTLAPTIINENLNDFINVIPPSSHLTNADLNSQHLLKSQYQQSHLNGYIQQQQPTTSTSYSQINLVHGISPDIQMLQTNQMIKENDDQLMLTGSSSSSSNSNSLNIDSINHKNSNNENLSEIIKNGIVETVTV